MTSFVPLQNQLADRLSCQVAERLEKAIEVKKALIGLNINEEICPNLKPFSKILNDWVKDGKFAQGKIKLPEINKKLVYQLASPKYTVVKLQVI
jgi:hypothetical protein